MFRRTIPISLSAALFVGSSAEAVDIPEFSDSVETLSMSHKLGAIFVSADELWGRSPEALWRWRNEAWEQLPGPLPYPYPGAIWKDLSGVFAICDGIGRWRYDDAHATLVSGSPPCILGFGSSMPMILGRDGWVVRDQSPWNEVWSPQQQPAIFDFRPVGGLELIEHPPIVVEVSGWSLLWTGLEQPWFGTWRDQNRSGRSTDSHFPWEEGKVFAGPEFPDPRWHPPATPPLSPPGGVVEGSFYGHPLGEDFLIYQGGRMFLAPAEHPRLPVPLEVGLPPSLAPHEWTTFDLNDDGCVDLVWLEFGKVVTRFGACVLPNPPSPTEGDTGDGGGDLDGDGFSVAEGDCDDADPLRNPAMAEVCDGLDNDCDGRTDQPSLWLDVAHTTKNEGAPWVAMIQTEGCISAYSLRIHPEEDLASCGLDEAERRIDCALFDEGQVEIELSGLATLATGQIESVGTQFMLEVTNVNPWIEGDSRPLVATLEDTGGSPERLERQFEGQDLGANDLLSWRLEGAPPGMLISDRGLVTWRPGPEDRGSHWVTVILEDGDGGRADLNFFARYEGEPKDSLDCCCLGSTAALGLPSLILLRARRRVHRQRSQQNRGEASRMSVDGPISPFDQPEP